VQPAVHDDLGAGGVRAEGVGQQKGYGAADFSRIAKTVQRYQAEELSRRRNT
jgi:hypothetical protein